MNEMMLGRRQMLGGTALLGLGSMLPEIAAAMPAIDLSKVKTRTTGKVEVLYKTPYYGANGMWMAPEGVWVIHQIAGNQATLLDINTGKVIREVQCEGVLSASGICIDEAGVMWIGSTYNRLIVAVDANTGKLIQKYSTPGAGQIYAVKGDVAGTRSPLQPSSPPPPPAQPANGARATGGRRGAGKQDASTLEGPAGTGAHCIVPAGPLLYVDVPPARAVFAINKESWEVDHMFPVVGNRPHDMAWADNTKTKLWVSDSNFNAFHLHDAQTGAVLEEVKLPAGSPVIHGAKLHNGYMYMCDDQGWMSRVKW